MAVTWLRRRVVLVRELAGARALAASLQAELDARTVERDAARDACVSTHRSREEAWRQVAEMRRLVEEAGGGASLEPPPVPRTPSGELLLARAHAAALEERLHLLQEASMSRDRTL